LPMLDEQAGFVEGETYSRRDDIHARFDGQRQGGISTPSDHPFVFIFTGSEGEKHGYRDGWHPEENVFLYTGEGQRGDMTFVRGNRAIRDHSADGRDILLFEALGKGKPVRFMGRFACQSWDTFREEDTDGVERESIQFHLIKVGSEVQIDTGDVPAKSAAKSLEDLRRRAREASLPTQAPDWREAKTAYRRRSQAVKDYVLARAKGLCELTGTPAPFQTRAGEPYLEVHHTRRLSDDGPDDPRHVAAICPAVHREIHYGENGDALNRELIKKLATIEPPSK